MLVSWRNNHHDRRSDGSRGVQGEGSVASRDSPRRQLLGMTLTQFLGAFNDNLFKQLVLLVCTDFVRKQQGDQITTRRSPRPFSRFPLFCFQALRATCRI